MPNETICPVCEKHDFDLSNDYDICPICGWENDGVQRDDHDYWGGANSLSVNESKIVLEHLSNSFTLNYINELLLVYKNDRKMISLKFKDIDHRTIDGQKCKNEFKEAHLRFINKLKKTGK